MKDIEIGQKLKYKRHTASKNTTVAFFQAGDEETGKKEICVIEDADGWVPNKIRVKKLGLDPKKKYRFVKSTQLSKK